MADDRDSKRAGAGARLAERFVRELLDSFEWRGRDAIEEAIAERPAEYLRVVASVLAKEDADAGETPAVTEIRHSFVRPHD